MLRMEEGICHTDLYQIVSKWDKLSPDASQNRKEYLMYRYVGISFIS